MLPIVDFSELRRRATAAAGPARQLAGKAATRNYFARSADVRRYVLARAKGICESCDSPAPFVTIAGASYLEPHHIRRLTDRGPDDPRYMGGICPNCHREIHHGKSGAERNNRLQERVTAREAMIAKSLEGEIAI